MRSVSTVWKFYLFHSFMSFCPIYSFLQTLSSSHCTRPSIPAASDRQVLTEFWHVVRPTMRDCAFAPYMRGRGWGGEQAHYITLHHWLDSGLGGDVCSSADGSPGPYAFNTGADVRYRPCTLHAPYNFPCCALHTASLIQPYFGGCSWTIDAIYGDWHVSRFG